MISGAARPYHFGWLFIKRVCEGIRYSGSGPAWSSHSFPHPGWLIFFLGPFLKILFLSGSIQAIKLGDLLVPLAKFLGPSLAETQVSAAQLILGVPLTVGFLAVFRSIGLFVFSFHQEQIALRVAMFHRCRLFSTVFGKKL